MAEDIVSTVPVAEWRGKISFFENAFETRPAVIRENLTCEGFAALVAPERPFLCRAKERGRFFLATTLRDAPLIGKTLERALAAGQPAAGKMRSVAHVVAGWVLKLDLDGISGEKLAALRCRLHRAGIAHMLYSTYSHGLKPGVRARLILFLDAALPPDDYRRATQGAAKTLLGASLDPSEGYLHQLAGVYVAHPDRAEQAFREVVLDGCCVSPSSLMAAAPGGGVQHVASAGRRIQAPKELTELDRRKVIRALDWIDANEFRTWTKTGMMLKALLPGEEGRALWINFSARASDSAKRRNVERKYDPASMWEGFAPVVSGTVALATLLTLARDGAAFVARQETAAGELTDVGQEAWVYLGRMHPQFADKLAEEVL